MKLNRKKLRKMILKEIKNLTESQVYPGSGLSHGFNNYELAKKLYDAVDNNEPEENLLKLRKTALRREAKLQFDLSQTQDPMEQGNIRQEIFLLNGAIDNLDHHLGLYEYGIIHSPDNAQMAPYGLSPEGYALQRRYQRRHADGGHEMRRPRDSDKLYDPNSPRYL